MELYTDAYYIKRVLEGDTASFACLIDKYGKPIHGLILRVVGNKEDAEELAQDTFLKAFKSLPSFKGDCGFSTWIYRIAYNSAISHVRKRRQEFLAIEEDAMESVAEEEEEEMFGEDGPEERIRKLEEALTRIPPDERALILLFYWKGKSVEELTTITGLTASNIKVKLYRIRKKLAIFIKETDNG